MSVYDIEWPRQRASRRLRHKWPGLNGIVIVASARQIDGKLAAEMHFSVASLNLLAHLIGPIVRDHWFVENNLHWTTDMVCRGDDCRVRTDHAPANLQWSSTWHSI